MFIFVVEGDFNMSDFPADDPRAENNFVEFEIVGGGV